MQEDKEKEEKSFKWLNEICGNCGKTKGHHHGGSNPWPFDYCPDPDCRMDWEKGPGTLFKPSGKYAERKQSFPWQGKPSSAEPTKSTGTDKLVASLGLNVDELTIPVACISAALAMGMVGEGERTVPADYRCEDMTEVLIPIPTRLAKKERYMEALKISLPLVLMELTSLYIVNKHPKRLEALTALFSMLSDLGSGVVVQRINLEEAADGSKDKV